MPDPTLQDALDELYSVDPAHFVATRKQLVARLRDADEKELAKTVAGLRKPTVAAAAINALAREQDPPGIPELSDLGARMRRAQSAMDRTALAELTSERADVVAALVGRLGDLTATVRDQVADTFVAAVASADAEQAVTSGQLVNPLSYSGFGEVEVSDAVAVPLQEMRSARLAELAEKQQAKQRSEGRPKVDTTDAGSTKNTPPEPVTATGDPADLEQVVAHARALEQEATAAVERAREALAAAKDHARNATRARQASEELLDRARDEA